MTEFAKKTLAQQKARQFALYRKEWSADEATYSPRLNGFLMTMLAYIAGAVPEMGAREVWSYLLEYRQELIRIDDEMFEEYMEQKYGKAE